MVLRILEWDSKFFKKNIAEFTFCGNELLDVNEMDIFKTSNKIDYIQSCIDIHDEFQINSLQDRQFNFIDLRLTFGLSIHGFNEVTKDGDVEVASVKDLDELIEISSGLFYDYSRFRQLNISRGLINSFYNEWLTKAVRGLFDDICLFIKISNRIAGFVTLKINERECQIGLLAVARNFQRQGVGKKLISAAINCAHEKRASKLAVTTEGKNIQAQNFYFSNMFHLMKSEVWFYRS